jgi:ankyrin repeat protein
MKVISCGRFQMAEACLQDERLASKLDVSAKNNEGNTLLMLLIQHMDDKLVNLLVGLVDVRPCLNEVNSDGNTALLLAATLGKWSIVQSLLENESLKGKAAGEGVDVHKANKEGLTCLVLILLAR